MKRKENFIWQQGKEKVWIITHRINVDVEVVILVEQCFDEPVDLTHSSAVESQEERYPYRPITSECSAHFTGGLRRELCDKAVMYVSLENK